MKTISVLAIINTLIWGLLIAMGHSDIESITAQHVVGFPDSGQITYYFYTPIIAVIVVLLAYLLALSGRFKVFSLLVESAALLVLLPYMLAYTGGI
jgi:hypothetical protein